MVDRFFKKSKNKTTILPSNPTFRWHEAAGPEKRSDLPQVTQLVSADVGAEHMPQRPELKSPPLD